MQVMNSESKWTHHVRVDCNRKWPSWYFCLHMKIRVREWQVTRWRIMMSIQMTKTNLTNTFYSFGALIFWVCNAVRASTWSSASASVRASACSECDNAIASCHPGRMLVPIRASSHFSHQSLAVLGISDIYLAGEWERERKTACVFVCAHVSLSEEAA